MSTIFVNSIKASTGNTVTIPNGHALQIGTKVLDQNAILPTTTGNEGKLIYSDGTSFIYSDYGASNMITFTANGTYTPSPSTRLAYVRVVGGGGGGTSYSETGGSGGYAEGYISMDGVSSVSITVGGGGNGTTYSGASAQGGTTSFGSYLSATGGNGANSNHRHCGGTGGLGSGGMLAIYGGGGCGHGRYNGKGGTNYFGGGGPGGHPNGGRYANNNQEIAAPGAGGACGWAGSHGGAKGKGGLVVVMEYM